MGGGLFVGLSDDRRLFFLVPFVFFVIVVVIVVIIIIVVGVARRQHVAHSGDHAPVDQQSEDVLGDPWTHVGFFRIPRLVKVTFNSSGSHLPIGRPLPAMSALR